MRLSGERLFRVAYYFVVSNTESQFTFDPSPNYALLIGLATGLLFIEPENIALKMVLAALGVVFLSWQVRETEPQSLMLLKNIFWRACLENGDQTKNS